MVSKHYYVSAYASSPSPEHWEPKLETAYFKALADAPKIIGIEHPFSLDAKRYPLPWLLKHIPAHWTMCITSVPVFMKMSQSYPHIGIASADEQGRQMAITLTEDINNYVNELNEAFARPVVKAIHLQTFPRQPTARGSQNALVESLHTIKNMNWHGAELNIEHCDAYIEGQPAEKGLLTLENEISAITQVGGYGLVLNWARSAIEYRSVGGPLKHLDLATSHELLKGFFFSGCDNRAASAYGQWADSHMPPRNTIQGTFLPAGGLLDNEAIQAVWQRLGAYSGSPYLGIKVTNRGVDSSVERSIGLTMESIAALDAACDIN